MDATPHKVIVNAMPWSGEGFSECGVHEVADDVLDALAEAGYRLERMRDEVEQPKNYSVTFSETGPGWYRFSIDVRAESLRSLLQRIYPSDGVDGWGFNQPSVVIGDLMRALGVEHASNVSLERLDDQQTLP